MNNLGDKIIEAGLYDRDTSISLLQYAAKMRRLKIPERRLENFISKAIDRVMTTKGPKKTKEQVLAQVIPTRRRK